MLCEFEVVFVFFESHCLKSLGQRSCIAVFTALGDLGAARSRVPRSFGPLDCRIICQPLINYDSLLFKLEQTQ